MKSRRIATRCVATFLLISCMGLRGGVAQAVTIEGTEYPAGTPIDDEFANVGVLFSSGLGYVVCNRPNSSM